MSPPDIGTRLSHRDADIKDAKALLDESTHAVELILRRSRSGTRRRGGTKHSS
jgi:hypothetical protein